jgi:hypothetical protein
MRRLLFALLGAPTGYIAFALAGYGMIEIFSGNGFDRSVEAATTAALLFGPVGAILGLIGGFIFGGRRAGRIGKISD